MLEELNFNKSDQDATEFLICLLKKLDNELSIPFTNIVEQESPFTYYELMRDRSNLNWLKMLQKEGYSIIKDLFYSGVMTVYECCKCGYK